MGSHPLNLGLRFLLELTALGAFGYWGWTQNAGWWRWVLVIGLPVIAAAIWGTFAVPNDPSRSGQAPIPTPGMIRLILELSIFALGAIALIVSQRATAGWAFVIIVLVHYAISYDRILWLFRN